MAQVPQKCDNTVGLMGQMHFWFHSVVSFKQVLHLLVPKYQQIIVFFLKVDSLKSACLI